MNEKKCTKCGKIKPINQFHIDNSRKDGHTSSCAECRTSQTKQYNKENEIWKSESQKRYHKKRMQTDRAKTLACHASTKWQRENPDKAVPYNRANASINRVKEKFPECVSSTISDILPLYEKAYMMEKESGTHYQIDHIVPLMAGGMHHPDNCKYYLKKIIK